MNKLYNTQGEIANNLNDFFVEVCKNNNNKFLSKVHLNILPFIIIGIIESESVVTSDIAKKLKGKFNKVKNESVQRRIRRFFNSNTFKPYEFYDTIIRHVIKNYRPRESDKRVHISFDHSFTRDRYTVISFNLRVGKQSISLWYKCFQGYAKNGAMRDEHIIEGVNYVHGLFKGRGYKLIFLGDRFFDSSYIISHIDSLKCFYNIRAKKNTKVFINIKNHNHLVKMNIGDIKGFVYKIKLFKDVLFTDKNKVKINLVISKSNGVKEPWYLITNLDPKRAIKDYSYRWSSECLFKNQKSNGFYLESTTVKNLNAFISLFTLTNIAILWLTILGVDYVKNKNKNNYFITDVKYYKKGPKRIISLFKTGLIYFNSAINSIIKRTIKCNFILYDY